MMASDQADLSVAPTSAIERGASSDSRALTAEQYQSPGNTSKVQHHASSEDRGPDCLKSQAA